MEDNDELAELMRMVLETRGFHVTHLPTGREAIRRAASVERPPDISIVDHGLPDVLGDDVARWLRAYFGEDAPILAYSATGDPGNVTRMLVAGCDAFLPKPSELRELIGTVNRLLTARNEVRAETRAAMSIPDHN